jgi:hypothetical protein
VSSLFPEYSRSPWWTSMSQLVEASPEPGDPEEAMDLCVALAVTRAQAISRKFVPLDAVIAASILCWNPFKPGPEGLYLDAAIQVRTELTDRLSRGVALVYEDTAWMQASTDQILAVMDERDPFQPAQLFLGSSASAGSGEPGLTV